MAEETIVCPTCEGRGAAPAFVDGPKSSGIATYPCERCGGKKVVPREVLRWIEDGKKMRARRIHSPDGYRNLIEEADRLKITVIELSKMERGIIKPITS